MLDHPQLENIRAAGGGRIRARCPACAMEGRDTTGNHLLIDADGRYGCAAYPGDDAHRKAIFALAGLKAEPHTPSPVRHREAPKSVTRPRAPLQLPVLHVPTLRELRRLAELRRLPFFAGLELAARAGQLGCATMLDAGESVSAWVLVDSANRCAQARRLDGRPWQHLRGEPKAWTLPGSQAAWPIGAADIGSTPQIALCEGGPDTLSVWSLLWFHGKAGEVAPVCLCGSHAIHSDALPYFRGKGVLLFPHRDPAGEKAQGTWTEQLRGAGAHWVRSFDVAPHKDLNEALTAAAAQLGDDA